MMISDHGPGRDKWEKKKRGRNELFVYEKVGLIFLLGFFIVGLAGYVYAQVGVHLDPTGRSGEEPKPLPKELPPAPPPVQVLPPLPPSPGEKPEALPFLRVYVREIEITGNTVFSDEELAKITAPYINRELTSEDLEALRLALTYYYINRGYINSGAIIPDQTVTQGVVTFHIIEGKLTGVEVEGNKWFSTSYFQKRVALGAGPPLNLYALQQRLQLLQQDERIQLLNAELGPGVIRGDSDLRLRVQEANPIKVWLTFDNYITPSVGDARGQVTIAHQNLSGRGDILSFTYGQTSGPDPVINTGMTTPIIDTYYTLPLNAYDTTLNIRYRKNNYLTIESPFENLNIESKSDIFGVTLRHPLYRTINHEFALAFTGEYLRNQTFLLGEPFSFYPGYDNGTAVETAFRFSQEWVYRAPTQVAAARSQLSFGVGLPGATIQPSGIPDSQFLAWLLQLRGARRHKLLDMQTIIRVDTQLTNQSLLPLEQISVGGRYSVRGYRENQLVRDNGFVASMEERLPLIRNKSWANLLELAAFADYGYAWNKEIATSSIKTLYSVGLGLRWEDKFRQPFQWQPQFEIYWGIPLRKVSTSGNSLQDHGIHFQFIIAAF
jgi:hemolysin activation/secretion protein